MASIDPITGYQLKTQDEYFEEERDLYLDIDSDWNLDPSTPDGLKLASDAEQFANQDEVLKRAYDSKDPDKATDTDLNIICKITGTVRSQGTPSTVAVTLGGTAGTVVAAGNTVKSTVDDTIWSIDSDITLPGSGTATCTTNGATEASIGTITKIVDVVAGWQTVTNPSVATLGTNRQGDASLRLERNVSVGRQGDYQLDSMRAELYAVDGVRRVLVDDNDDDNTDVNGVPPHNTYAIVDGGSDEDVAAAIYLKKGAGTPLYQAATPVTVAVTSPKYPSIVKNIKFSRPIYDDMIVGVTITSDGTLPVNAADDIAEAIVAYANGESSITTTTGFNLDGFDIGEDAPPARLFTPVNQYLGLYGNSYCTGITIDGSPGVRAVAFNALSRWTTDNVTVVINA